jgi:hypothetical protein
VDLSALLRTGSQTAPAVAAHPAVERNGSAQAAGSTSDGAYTALTPTRLLDTRASGQPLGANGSLSLTVTGGSVPAGATAVALNVSVTDTTASSYLSVYPAGETRPLLSNLNWVAGETVPNLVIVAVGVGGQVTFYNDQGSTDLVVDLEGYFAPEPEGTTAGSYVPLTPARITDTRPGSGEPNAGQTLGAGTTRDIQVTGAGGVPASGVTAALLNVTVTDTSSSSYLTVYPQGVAQPLASNLNWVAGATVANRVVIPVSSAGQITVYNQLGSADVVVDVNGYFTNGSSTPAGASLFTPMSPIRVLDTRSTGQTLGPGTTLTQQMTGLAGIIAANVTAVVTNVTATDTTAPSFFTVYPGGSPPTASDVNWVAGETVPNLTVASLSGSGAMDVFNDAGSADLVIDAFGYFANIAPASPRQNDHWSGYSVESGPYTSVSGTFNVPDLNAAPTETYMSEWAGIDGVTNQDLIQAGVGETYDPTTNLVYTQAWWEILPAAETPIVMTVLPGESVTVTIGQVSGTLWSIELTDNTTRQTFTTEEAYAGPSSSVDWIVEAPEVGGVISTLGDYSPDVTFSDLGLAGSQNTLTYWVMVQNGVQVSTPSTSLTASGFAVAYGGVAPAAP